MTSTPPASNNDNDDQRDYQVDSRKEIIALLRSLHESNQLITMIINEGNEVIITAILKVDDESNSLILDCAASESSNQRLVEAKRVYFEAALNKISIQFSTFNLQHVSHQGRPALSCPIPLSLIRLQRRENYRIITPVVTPIYCLMHIPESNGGGSVKLPLVDISCGGVSMLDEKQVLNMEFSTLYTDCQMELPGIGKVSVTLQVRNSQSLTLKNHKISRRIGFQFINLSHSMMSQIQKLITKIERERNARQTGLN